MATLRSASNAPGRKALRLTMIIRLARGKALPIRNAAGRIVRAHEGLVWITEESASADILLRPGESFRLARPGLAVLEAFEDASVHID
jgi:hypothetical protein